MFIAACEGYFDKENDLSALLRLQTFLIVQSSGAKKNGGGNIILTDMWKLRNESNQVNKVIWGTKEEADEFRKKIEEKHGIKLG